MSISTKREYKGALTIKLIAIIASLYGIILNWKGLFSLTYFTNLSNIFMVCVLFLCLGKLGMIWQNKLYKKRITRDAADTEGQTHR